MNNLNRKLKEASELFLSIRLSLLLLTAQLLAELILVSELIGLFGGYLGIFPNFEFDGARFFGLVLNAWFFNLIYLLSIKINYFFESQIPESVSKKWIETQKQLENWIENQITLSSLAELSLEIVADFAIFLLDLYIYHWSPDYKYLIRLVKTEKGSLWAYFLAEGLAKYRFYWWNPFEQQIILKSIYSNLRFRVWLEDEEQDSSLIEEKAADYVRKLSISLPQEDTRESLDPLRESEDRAEPSSENAFGTNSEPHELSEPEATENTPGGIPRGCNNCKYLYGEIIHGKLLVCAIHPYGLDDCPDFEVIPAIALTHSKCQLPNFYGVRTSMSLEDLKRAIAILQISRARLPSFETVEDSLYPDTVVELLGRLYECDPIVSPNPFPVDSTLDISENWDNSVNRGLLNDRLATREAYKVILALMISQAKQKHLRYRSNPDYYDILIILELIFKGYYVPIEWGLKTVTGEPYTGAIALFDEPNFV